MKYLIPVILCTSILSACGGGSSEPSIAEANPVAPNPELEGLWLSYEIYEKSNVSDRFVIPDDSLMYFNFIGADENPVESEIYVKSESENCFSYGVENFTHIGNNRYRDSINEAVDFTTANNDNELSFGFSSDGLSLVVVFIKVENISNQDIPVCETDAALLNDYTDDSFYAPLADILD